MSDPTPAPLFSIVRGNPSAQDIAALTVVLTSIGQSSAQSAPRDLDLWASRGRALLAKPVPGPFAWRDSGLPR